MPSAKNPIFALNVMKVLSLTKVVMNVHVQKLLKLKMINVSVLPIIPHMLEPVSNVISNTALSVI